jgi:hypothetical protein
MRPRFPDCREARAVQQSSHPPTHPRPRSRRRLRPAGRRWQTPIWVRMLRDYPKHERTAGTIRCFAMGKSCFRAVSHASGRSLSARSSAALKKAPPKRGFNCPHGCRRHSPHPDNVEPGLRFDELDRILRQEACSLEAGRRSLALTLMAAPSFGDLTTAAIMAPIAKPLRVRRSSSAPAR